MKKELDNNLSWILVGLTVFIALVVLFYANSNFYQEFINTSESLNNYAIPKNSKAEHAFVELDFGNGQRRAFRGEVDGATYGLKDSLELISKVADFTFREKNGRIENLAGVGNAPGSWKIYKNGEPHNQPLPQLTITKGDKYVLRFEK